MSFSGAKCPNCNENGSCNACLRLPRTVGINGTLFVCGTCRQVVASVTRDNHRECSQCAETRSQLLAATKRCRTCDSWVNRLNTDGRCDACHTTSQPGQNPTLNKLVGNFERQESLIKRQEELAVKATERTERLIKAIERLANIQEKDAKETEELFTQIRQRWWNLEPIMPQLLKAFGVELAPTDVRALMTAVAGEVPVAAQTMRQNN